MTYAGDITPQEAWDLLASNSDAVLVDVRTPEEWRYVGVPDTAELGKDPAFIPWVSADGVVNPEFVAQLQQAGVSADDPVLFLCRSGQRSIAAANAATAAGLGPAYNVLQGFEGGIAHDGHRGASGWKATGLAWKQS